MNFAEACRRENIEDEVLSAHERLVFDALSLHEYKQHRAARGVAPLTTWQEEQLMLERIAALTTGNNNEQQTKP